MPFQASWFLEIHYIPIWMNEEYATKSDELDFFL